MTKRLTPIPRPLLTLSPPTLPADPSHRPLLARHCANIPSSLARPHWQDNATAGLPRRTYFIHPQTPLSPPTYPPPTPPPHAVLRASSPPPTAIYSPTSPSAIRPSLLPSFTYYPEAIAPHLCLPTFRRALEKAPLRPTSPTIPYTNTLFPQDLLFTHQAHHLTLRTSLHLSCFPPPLKPNSPPPAPPTLYGPLSSSPTIPMPSSLPTSPDYSLRPLTH